MSRKLYTVSGILLLCGIIILAFFFLRKGERLEGGNPVKAIPIDAAILIQVNNFSQLKLALSGANTFTTDLEPFKSFRSIQNTIAFVDTAHLFASMPGAGISNRPFWFSIHPRDDNDANWMVNSSISTRAELGALKRLINSLAPFTEEINVNGHELTRVKPNNLIPRTIYLSLRDGIITISGSAEAVATSLSQRNRGQTLLDDSSFAKIHGTSFTSNLALIYLNLGKTGELTSNLFSAPFAGSISNWVKLDLNVRDNSLSLNGFNIGRSDFSFTDLFIGTTPRKNQIFEIVPSSTRFLMSYSFYPVNQFSENFERFTSRGRLADSINAINQKFRSKYGKDFTRWLFSFVDSEGVLIYSDPGGTGNGLNRLLAFSTAGTTNALQVLTNSMQKNGKNIEPVSYAEIDPQTRFPVYEMPEPEPFKQVLSVIFPYVPSSYFAFYKNFIIFSNSREAFRDFMHANLLNQTLSSNQHFTSFIESFPLTENFFLFVEIPYIHRLAKRHLNPGIFSPTIEQTRALGNFYGIGVQMSTTNNMVYTSIHANHLPGRDKEPRTIWQSRLDGNVIGKPALVRNHDTGETEILVQDNLNNLYLVNRVGRVLWKQQLDGPIKSEIFQVDYYRNDKLQYLFNTATRVYLLDRNGNHVARFPLVLPATATAGIGVFDYDNNHDYRIFVPLDDRRVYLFDRSGNRVPGWNVPQVEGVVELPVQYFRDKGRDYIVFSDQYKTYILDRRGNTRVTPWQNFRRNLATPFYLTGRDSDEAALVTSTNRGELAKIALPSGETTITPMLENPAPHTMTLSRSTPGQEELLFVTNYSLQIFNRRGARLLDLAFEHPVHPNVDLYRFGPNDIKFGVVEKNRNKIHLINRDGSSHSGFPLPGTSRFSIGNLQQQGYRFNLVAGGELNYLNNYGVD